MEIDGNKANAAGFDWNDIQDGTLPGGYVISPTVVSTGVVAQTYQIDGPSIIQSCGVQDANSLVDGSKLDQNPWPVQSGLPNSKNDICSGGAALEAVNVNGAVHYILYEYYTRTPSATGDQSVVMSLEGPLAGRCDDLLIDYNFGPSSGLVTTLYRWTPTAGDACANPLGAGSWGGASVVSGTLVQTASGPNPELSPATANADTFGEFAIDLTASGVLPADRCATFTTGSTLTYTGNSTNASLKDILIFSNPLVLSNCGSISVAKVTQPAGFGAGLNFGYKLDQTDAQPVHGASLSVTGGGADTDGSNLSISSLIQTTQTHVWSNVLAQPDYRLQEVSMPADWQVKEITCSFWDPFFVSGGIVVPQLRTVTTTASSLSSIGITSPQLKPAGQPNTTCTITNATSGIRLVKAGSGDANQAFTFTMTGKTVPALKLGGSADFAFAPGANVSINETLPEHHARLAAHEGRVQAGRRHGRRNRHRYSSRPADRGGTSHHLHVHQRSVGTDHRQQDGNWHGRSDLRIRAELGRQHRPRCRLRTRPRCHQQQRRHRAGYVHRRRVGYRQPCLPGSSTASRAPTTPQAPINPRQLSPTRRPPSP